jgi:hypothetical protein
VPKSWKDSLLKSGLPFEYEVKSYLQRLGCLPSFDSSYVRLNEQKTPREFSFDLSASLFERHYMVDLMVECKYRHPAVRWVWAADEYGGPSELAPNAFLHPLDDFVKSKFPFADTMFPRRLGPLCSKGIELLPDGPNEAGITEALSQLAYALGPRMADSIEHQVRNYIPPIAIYCHVPVIVTTASMFRLREDVTVNMIASAEAVEDVANEVDCVIVRYQPGIELKEHNRNAIQTFLGCDRDELTASLSSYSDNLDFVLNNLIDRNPAAVVAISVAKGWQSFDRLLEYVKQLLAPSTALIDEIREQDRARRARFDALTNAKPLPG